ncbi:MAG: hypothetical protein H7287_01105 [Thermoleophilia bacterium]|nr:hypothetical protein [Thermoleophilia bacterium]
MSLPPIDTNDPEALLLRVLELSVPLHPAIAAFDEVGARYLLEGAPGVASFHRDAGDTIGHVSGSPSPLIMPILDDLRRRHMHAAGIAEGHDNSHLPALLLLCCYIADGQALKRVQFEDVVRRPAQVIFMDEESGTHDPDLEPLDAALRAWTPIRADHILGSPAHPAVLELRFAANRYSRHVPWEGRLGETGRVPG